MREQLGDQVFHVYFPYDLPLALTGFLRRVRPRVLLMVETGSLRVLDILSRAAATIAEGEVLQLLNCNDPDTDEARYREVILRKTATLFEAGSRLGGVISEAEEAQEQALADYGRHLGMAFQMIDDALDYGASGADIGKNIGDDLAEGKPTLPLIRAIACSDDGTRDMLRAVIENGGTQDIERVLAAIESTDAIAYTARLATDEAARRGLSIAVSVADMRQAHDHHARAFDLVLACDNALPHLLTDDELIAATITGTWSTRPTAVITESSEKMMSRIPI